MGALGRGYFVVAVLAFPDLLNFRFSEFPGFPEFVTAETVD